MLTVITGFFPHLDQLLRGLVHAHVLSCVRVHHPHGWVCRATVNPGGPALVRR